MTTATEVAPAAAAVYAPEATVAHIVPGDRPGSLVATGPALCGARNRQPGLAPIAPGARTVCPACAEVLYEETGLTVAQVVERNARILRGEHP